MGHQREDSPKNSQRSTFNFQFFKYVALRVCDWAARRRTQNCILPYRRFLICTPADWITRRSLPADCSGDLQLKLVVLGRTNAPQSATLRYSRLKICATGPLSTDNDPACMGRPLGRRYNRLAFW